MGKQFIYLLFLLLPLSAQAHTVCSVPTFYDGYSKYFQNTSTVSGVIYGLREQFLYTIMPNGFTNGFINVPSSTAASFMSSPNPDHFYLTQMPEYHQTLMTEDCRNILTESGRYIVLR